MKTEDINIRDPFVLVKNDVYYMYGTRAKHFGMRVKGFDVYIGNDLENWEKKVVFDSTKYRMNREVNWAPEVHEYNGKYYMFATFTRKKGMRGTYSLVCDTPDGEFKPLSKGPLTPLDWYALDGTLYVGKNGKPYLVFCHEHVQILNGTICYIPLSDDLSTAIGEPKLMFYGSDAYKVETKDGKRFVTDGPFMYRGKNDRLYMIWSTVFPDRYVQCLAVSSNGEIDGKWTQLPHIFDRDGGHGMLFKTLDNKLYLTLHSPNKTDYERPAFFPITDTGEGLTIDF